MSLYMLEFPVAHSQALMENYDSYYPVYLHFESETCPTKEQVLQAIDNLHERDSQYPEYTGDWLDARQAIEKITDYPYLNDRVVQSSRLVCKDSVTGFQYITLKKINVIKL